MTRYKLISDIYDFEAVHKYLSEGFSLAETGAILGYSRNAMSTIANSKKYKAKYGTEDKYVYCLKCNNRMVVLDSARYVRCIKCEFRNKRNSDWPSARIHRSKIEYLQNKYGS